MGRPFASFDNSIDHLRGSKMGLVDNILHEPQKEAVNKSIYDKQFVAAK